MYFLINDMLIIMWKVKLETLLIYNNDRWNGAKFFLKVIDKVDKNSNWEWNFG